ncbi:hypothetical protein bthur0004_28630 [Bacillus thuringiensis serovar sotto str. T04001]|nr:hypothetical protein bthur0004_28630 [Bacillus thuringiensis serovar sotto str. T04001]
MQQLNEIFKCKQKETVSLVVERFFYDVHMYRQNIVITFDI